MYLAVGFLLSLSPASINSKRVASQLPFRSHSLTHIALGGGGGVGDVCFLVLCASGIRESKRSMHPVRETAELGLREIMVDRP